MKVKELIEKTGWKDEGTSSNLEGEVVGAYCGDLLSWVMGNGEQGQAWITVQGHINVVAVAKLREFSCIIIADNAPILDEFMNKAEEEDIVVLSSGLPVYETAKVLVELGV
ncbi:MAG: hypothetical protein J6D29_07955 [Solobacterium sp.]|nr:hypothetical protein [Solobacterium sp.]